MDTRGSIDFNLGNPPPNGYIPISSSSFPLKHLQQNDQHQLHTLVAKTQSPLLTVKSIFWFDFFPDKMIIDQNKVSFIYKDMLGIRSIHSVLIENITFVEARTGLLTGKLIVTDSTNYRIPIDLVLENLKRSDAIKARKLIQGLMQAKRDKIELDTVDLYQLAIDLENLGQVKGED
jgi:hypothetical protein